MERALALFRCRGCLCYYSNAPLSLKFASQFRISVERVDNAIGHVMGNVVLVCSCLQFGLDISPGGLHLNGLNGKAIRSEEGSPSPYS